MYVCAVGALFDIFEVHSVHVPCAMKPLARVSEEIRVLVIVLAEGRNFGRQERSDRDQFTLQRACNKKGVLLTL